MKAILQRLNSNDKQTIGSLTCYNEAGEQVFNCVTLELAWLNNTSNKSCIPIGNYKVVTNFSNKYKKDMYEITEVKDRTGIRIHSGNFSKSDTLGCILVGRAFKDLDSDGQVDLVLSFDTLTKLTKKMGSEFILEIKGVV